MTVRGGRPEPGPCWNFELARNTFPSGLNREMATDYHGLVAELALVAMAEADHASRPLSGATVQLLCDILDAAAAILDARMRPPRQGDSDDGRALVLDDHADPWTALLALGRSIFGAPGWWPDAPAGVTSTLVGSVARPHHREVSHRARRPSHFPDAGLTILRARLGRWRGTVVPLRRRASRLSLDRRPRPCRCSEHRGPPRRYRAPRRPRNLLLPGPPPLAPVLPLDAGPQHGRACRL